jgi:hypothetical protein
MENQVVERIRKEISKDGLAVSRVYKSDYQKENTLTAELKQTVITKSYYPSKSVANNMQDNIFGSKEFGFKEQEFTNNEKRVAWIDVPEGMTPEAVAKKLESFPDATLYRVLSNHPILTDNQVYAIGVGLTTKDVFAENQIVRYPEGSENAGKLALDNNGKPQYRAIFFSNTAKEDQDMRTEAANDAYVSQAIAAEINIGNHIVTDQKL